MFTLKYLDLLYFIMMNRDLLFVGNALLDISCQYNSCDILTKYKLKVDDNCEAEQWQLPLFDEIIARKDVLITPGGSSQNSARIAKYVLNNLNSNSKVYFIGCIGDDDNGKILENALINSGVEPIYFYIPSIPTGISAGIITSSSNRTLMANIGASSCFDEEFFKSEKVLSALNQSKIFYIEGYLLAHSSNLLLPLVQQCWRNKLIFSLGLSANYIVTEYFEELMHLMPFGDLIFCNKNEAQTFILQLTGDLVKDIKSVGRMIVNIDKNRPIQFNNHNDILRIVFITQGPDDVIVAIKYTDNRIEINNFPVPTIDELSIGDTIGVGDSFVGSILAKLSFDENINQAVEKGIEIAAIVCSKRGCVID